MINFLIGKPGDGKTMKAVREMLAHLRSLDPRPLVSNIALKKQFCVDWLVENSNKDSQFWFDHLERTYFYIQEEQLTEFYRYRGELVLTKETDVSMVSWGGAGDRFPDFERAKSGVVYFIDEIHIPFSSYKGQDKGPQIAYYLSQHRKLGDDAWCITQHPDQVAVALRRLVFSYIVVRNMFRLKFGPFKMPGKFVEKHFPEVPRRGQIAMAAESFPLDPLVCKCYDTTAGVGIGANRAPELVKAKGIPLHFLWVIGAVFLALITLGPWMAAKYLLPMPTVPERRQVSPQAAPASKGVTRDNGGSGLVVPASLSQLPKTSERGEGIVILPRVTYVRLGLGNRVSLILETGEEIDPYDSGYAVSIIGDIARVNGVNVQLLHSRPAIISSVSR